MPYDFVRYQVRVMITPIAMLMRLWAIILVPVAVYYGRVRAPSGELCL